MLLFQVSSHNRGEFTRDIEAMQLMTKKDARFPPEQQEVDNLPKLQPPVWPAQSGMPRTDGKKRKLGTVVNERGTTFL